MFGWRESTKVRKLRRQVAELQTQLECELRRREVLQAEIEQMSLALARDRSRLLAEAAIHQSRRAVAEGGPVPSDEQYS